MTEQTPEQIPPAEPVPQPASATQQAPNESDADWRNRFEAQQKVNRDLERKLNELRGGLAKAFNLGDGEKPEPDALAQRVNSLQERLDAAERRSTLLNVASEYGVPKDYQHLLTGSDEESLRSQAAAVSELVKGRHPATPAPDPSQGAQPLTPEAQAEAEYAQFFPTNRK